MHEHMHRVRYADTDKMGMVYHGRYFEWFEAARTEMLRDNGFPYSEIESKGILLPVVEAQCRYRQPVVYDELVLIQTELAEFTRSRIRLTYQVMIGTEKRCRAEGHTIHCYLNPEGRPVRAPVFLMDIFHTIVNKQ